MIAHKSVSQTRTVSSFYLFLVLAAVMLLLALFLSGLFVPAQSATMSGELQFQTYRNNNYGYSIAYPASWQVIDQSQFGVFSASSTLVTNEERGGTNFSQRQSLEGIPTPISYFSFSKIDVLVYNLESEMSAADFLRAKSSTTPEGSLTSIKLGNLDAIKVSIQPGQVLENHQDISTSYVSVFVTNGKHGYIIAGSAEPAVLDRILNSFQAF
jgi:hypothetical protein